MLISSEWGKKESINEMNEWKRERKNERMNGWKRERKKEGINDEKMIKMKVNMNICDVNILTYFFIGFPIKRIKPHNSEQ